MLMMAEKGEACHTTNVVSRSRPNIKEEKAVWLRETTTNGPPTIGPPGLSAVAMDGLPGPCTVSTLGRGGTIYGT